MANVAPVTSVEAKIVVLGTQGVGKTSLVHRYVKHAFIPPSKAQSTIGASFLTTRVTDFESGTTIRLQIWDTAGQERFRSISKLYYRGAHAAILCYDVTSLSSFKEMGRWLQELRENCGPDEKLNDMIIHVVGTKSDVVAADPQQRQVTYEQCIEYVSEQLYPAALKHHTNSNGTRMSSANGGSNNAVTQPNSNRSSGFWNTDSVWDCCHEVSSKDGEGIDEVFRVITRKLIEQHTRRMQATPVFTPAGATPGGQSVHQGYFDMPNGNGSFRLGHGDKRRSWLGLSTPGGINSIAGHGDEGDANVEGHMLVRNGRCCG